MASIMERVAECRLSLDGTASLPGDGPLCGALLHHRRPLIFHSDNGKEYTAKVFVGMLESVGALISRSHPGCPWENGYQESFYDKFKVDLGDPNRFKTLGELTAEVYLLIHSYNHDRIHTSLKMPPSAFADRQRNQVSLN